MDQTKIGRFIATIRKEQSLTQCQLAEQLGISDKTVSKWETGHGLPEVSLMLPLCQILGISVNELLTGEKIVDSEYKKKAEETMMNLVKEKEESKKKIWLAVFVTLLAMLGGIPLLLLSETLEMSTSLRIGLIVIGLLVLFGGCFVAGVLDREAGTFECRQCSTRFVPSLKDYIAGPHSLTTRYLTCPSCGAKTCCKRRLTH